MQKKLAWITGAEGLIGRQIVAMAGSHAPGWSARGLSRADADLLDFAAVELLFRKEQPELVVHCAALSRSPDCQADPNHARRINVEATRHLAGLAESVPFILFSTDLVFDGRDGNYFEVDQVNPLSVYAETKVEAEVVVRRNPRHSILRTSLNGGVSASGARGFNEELRKAWSRGLKPKLFVDEYRCPIPASATARAVWEFAQNYQGGTYHLAGAERLSRLEIGQAIAERWPHLAPQLEPGSLRDYVGAPRSPDTSLNCAKLQRLLRTPLPGLRQWLRENPQVEF